jgi:hypothetical protein
VTREAGEAVLRLTEKAPQADPVRTARDEVEQKLETMRSWPKDEVVQLISPIVFSLGGERRLAALLDPMARVDFDQRGFGPRQRWSWLRSTTGLLVRDPARTGAIVSGRQLFGNFTFQIEWATGYHALAALDDDGDGWLRGAELSGVRAWFDRDGDGRSAPDEVMDLSACGIVAIAVHATGREGVHPTNPRGVLMADGSASPSWDWMTEPIRD